MHSFVLSVLFFTVGFVEYAIDQYEKMVSVRLKFLQTLFWSVLNQLFDLFIIIFFSGAMFSFWEKFHELGVKDYSKIIPFVLYIVGRVLGTSGSVLFYKERKKKQDREKAIKYLEKHNKKKKKRGKKHKNAILEANHAENLLDAVEMEDLKTEVKERAVEAATKQVTDRIESAFNENT